MKKKNIGKGIGVVLVIVAGTVSRGVHYTD